ncbi:ArnT family glycosyltransferase [Eupransor demetentiae]|uniref:Involved in glycosylation of proteins and lipid IVA (ArnT) n=1 Tax=Eupransor demetentiae TaxID=3109584 RepID=A0ABM9N6K0_9LACO|nr:PMT family glycosyltransferase ArnT/Agl22 [Lactobacillaceae bacterium LMG 33000]
MQKAHKHSILALILGISLLAGVLFNSKIPNGALLTSAALVGLVLLFLLKKTLSNLKPSTAKRWVYLLFALMVVGQILVIHFMKVTVYHDPYRVLSQADQMVAGDFSWNTTYFWRYPNNVPITYLLFGWLKVTNFLHLTNNTAIHLLSMLILDGFIALMLRTVWQISKRPTFLLGAAAFFMLTPFAYSYYLQVFYTDLPSMLFLLLIFRMVYFWGSGSRALKISRAIGLIVVSLLAFLIKANIIVIVPAFLIVLAVLAIRQKHFFRNLAVPLAFIILGIGLAVPTTSAIYQASHYQKHDSYEFPASHWILMGYNEKEAGMYAGKDVHKDASLSSRAERQRYDLQEIGRRIKSYGPSRLANLWAVKLAVLLDVRDIQNWYNGGFRQAPHWYQQHGRFYDALQSMIYYLANMALFVLLGLRLLVWRPNRHRRRDQLTLLIITTALGYLAFHVSLWEVENRYGQLILPLIWFILALLPEKKTTWQIEQTWLRRTLFVALSLTGIAGIITTAAVIAQREPRSFVIAAQRSQLSTQYGAKPDTIAAGSTIKQGIYFHRRVGYFTTQVYYNSPLQASLYNEATKKSYPLIPRKNDDIFRTEAKMPAGQYQLVIHNQTKHKQDIEIIKANHYKIADQPLEVDGRFKQYESLIYMALDK